MRCLTVMFVALTMSFVSAAFADSNRISVLAYHAITLNPDRGNLSVVSLPRFESQMRYLHDAGYRTLALSELDAFMNGAPMPERSVVITFDDGWKSQLRALPVLRKYNHKAAFFIFPDGGIAPERQKRGNYMKWSDLRAISNDPNFEIQAHSMTHPYVRSSNLVTWVRGDTPGRDHKDALFELVESKAILERELGKPVDYFAWPGGWYNKALIEMAKQAGYRALFTAEAGGVRPGRDVYRTYRFMVNGACPLHVFKRTVSEHRHIPCPPMVPPEKDVEVLTAQREETTPE